MSHKKPNPMTNPDSHKGPTVAKPTQSPPVAPAKGLASLERLCRDAESLAIDPRLDGDARFSILWNYCRFERERVAEPDPAS